MYIFVLSVIFYYYELCEKKGFDFCWYIFWYMNFAWCIAGAQNILLNVLLWTDGREGFLNKIFFFRKYIYTL